jgi:hypothetical protein
MSPGRKRSLGPCYNSRLGTKTTLLFSHKYNIAGGLTSLISSTLVTFVFPLECKPSLPWTAPFLARSGDNFAPACNSVDLSRDQQFALRNTWWPGMTAIQGRQAHSNYMYYMLMPVFAINELWNAEHPPKLEHRPEGTHRGDRLARVGNVEE